MHWLRMFFVAAYIVDMESPEWRIREKATREATNIVFALLSPPNHPDPEVNSRVQHIKNKYMFWTHTERWMWLNNRKSWFQLFFFKGKNKLYTDDDIFDMFRESSMGAWEYLFMGGDYMTCLKTPFLPQDREIWHKHLERKRAATTSGW